MQRHSYRNLFIPLKSAARLLIPGVRRRFLEVNVLDRTQLESGEFTTSGASQPPEVGNSVITGVRLSNAGRWLVDDPAPQRLTVQSPRHSLPALLTTSSSAHERPPDLNHRWKSYSVHKTVPSVIFPLKEPQGRSNSGQTGFLLADTKQRQGSWLTYQAYHR